MTETRTPQPDQIKDREIEPSKEYSLPLPEEFLALLDEAGLETHKEAYQTVLNIADDVKALGGRALLVGGSVRDFLMGKISKDFDVEIYGLEADVIKEIVEKYGKVEEVGEAFGVLKVMFAGGIDIDVSLPRKDSKTGEGHKGFSVETDPNMSVKDAARRRDFTFNSVCANPITGELFDPFGGADDIKDGILKVTDEELFKDDPLRVLRAVQFIGRFGFEIDSTSIPVLKEMAQKLKELPKERIGEEWRKLLLKSDRPSVGLEAAMELGVLREIHPEFTPLQETEQEHEWHPEGNVWIHTKMVTDEAARIVKKEKLDSDSSMTMMLAALCHDLGKPATTEFIDGKIRSRGHEEAGEDPTRAFLETINTDKATVNKVVKLVIHHLKPTLLHLAEEKSGKKIKNGTIRRLAKALHPATIRELVMVAEADHFGRESLDGPITEFPAKEWLLEKARQLEVEDRRPEDLTRGRDWMERKYRGGPNIGKLIFLSNELRDDKEMTRDEILNATEGMNEHEAIAKLQSMLTG